MSKRTYSTVAAGVVLGVLLGLFGRAAAQDLGGATTADEPAKVLIMPFDVTQGKASFELVHRIGGESPVPIATHWSFWSESCDHLADAFICLTPRDSVVVDPARLQSQKQSGATNTNSGQVVDLSGEKGFVTVTAYFADPLATACEVAEPDDVLADPVLVGSWVVANTATNAAYGNDALGLVDSGTLPDANTFFPELGSGGLFIFTYSPTNLKDSEVFLIGVATQEGVGPFSTSEIGPIPANLPNGAAACCNAQFINNVEAAVSLPDVCLTCSLTAKVAENAALSNVDLPAIVPSSIPADTSGIVRLMNCVVGNSLGVANPIGQGAEDSNGDLHDAFIFAFHGMAVGPFGTSARGKYTAE